ncbi:MAG: pyridoxal kinase [Hyphomicrobium sp.]|uniref:PfkB family carbohydrate kinase n=1 Tax=Hyphomicrobium sp. TaxID=82 RepID=UPI0039E2E724
MRRILMISSYVARDPVGLTATAPPLQRAGIEVVGLPTVVLSNHPIRAHIAGITLDPRLLGDMVRALADNGWLASFDAVFSGYLPSVQHVEMVASAVTRLKTIRPEILFVCDPIFGDDPGGLYIDEKAARAIRDLLVPLADVLTPNRFELSWLSGRDVATPADAFDAIAQLGRPIIAGTSIPDGDGVLATAFIADGRKWLGSVEKWRDVPHGTGDVFAGCLTARLMLGDRPEQALAYAIAGVRCVLQASRGADYLKPYLVDWTTGVTPAQIAPIS